MLKSMRSILWSGSLLVLCLGVSPSITAEIEIDPDGFVDGCIANPEENPCQTLSGDRRAASSCLLRIWDRLSAWIGNLEDSVLRLL